MALPTELNTNIPGSMAKDTRLVSIQEGSWTKFQDATGTPQVSPLATTTALKTILVPTGAVKCVIHPTFATTTDWLLVGLGSALDATAGNGYARVFHGGSIELPCAGKDNIYWKSSASNATVDFFFVGV